ncbi:MAG: YHS domain-containing protein [Fimbriiglobus sp.]|nr:YHS domain-containing protein [Fimbriiglobus sp.]
MFVALLLASTLTADPIPDAKLPFRPLAPLIGGWKCSGKADDSDKTIWGERAEWAWKFQGNDAWLTVVFEKGKHFTAGELRYDSKEKHFTLKLTTPDKTEQTFTGTLGEGKQKEPILTLERPDGETLQRFTLTLLHANRHLYQMSSRPKTLDTFTRRWLVGATKEGEAFADVAKGPECIVSGGAGTIAVTHKGTTYYVCCSGCKDEFKSDPEKYIQLAAQKKK